MMHLFCSRLNPNIDRGDTDMEDDLGCDSRKDKPLPRAHKSQRAPTSIEDLRNFDRRAEQNQHQSENGNKTSEEKHLGSANTNDNMLGKTGQVKEENNANKTSVESTNQEIVNNNNNPETDKENVVDPNANSSKQVTNDSTAGSFVSCINNFKIKNNSSESMEAASETSSDCVTQETDLDDFCHSQGRSSFPLTVQSPHILFQ